MATIVEPPSKLPSFIIDEDSQENPRESSRETETDINNPLLDIQETMVILILTLLLIMLISITQK